MKKPHAKQTAAAPSEEMAAIQNLPLLKQKRETALRESRIQAGRDYVSDVAENL